MAASSSTAVSDRSLSGLPRESSRSVSPSRTSLKSILRPVEVNAADLHLDPRADDITYAAALAAQFLPDLVKAEILAAEFGDVDQPFDIKRIERDEEAKTGDRTDGAGEFFAEMLTHVLALEPGLDVARGLVRTPLARTRVCAGDLPGREVLAAHPRHRPRRRLGTAAPKRRFGRGR